MKIKLGHRLILSYLALALVIIGLISLIVNFNIKRGFEKYIIEEHQQLVSDLLIDIERTYDGVGFDLGDIQNFGVDAIENGLIITVYNQNEGLVWSAMEHNAGLCEEMITNVQQTMFANYASWDGQYTEDTYLLETQGTAIGRLTVGYLGPFYFNEEGLYFLSSINQVLIVVGVGSLLIAVAIGMLIGKSVTRPIQDVIYHLNHINDSKKVAGLNRIHQTRELHELDQAALKLENRIHEQEKLRQQLTQDMAHELKTPLTALQGQLEAMIDGIFPLTQERIESSYEEIIRIKSLIQEIESLAIMENNNTKLSFKPFNLEEMIAKVLHDFESELLKNKITAKIVPGESYNPQKYHNFNGDRDKLCQVFVNLISNSLKYAGANTQITIVLDYRDNHYFIQFKDNGSGINEEDIPYIFERFYRADPSRTGHNGLGIGLTLVKSIINKHSGTIEYDKNHVPGTGLNITLPRIRKEQPQ